MEKIRIAIADDHHSYAEYSKNYLNRVTDLKVVETVHNGPELFAYLEHTDHLPDVLLLDYRMPKFNSLSAIKQIRKDFPRMHVIVLSMIDDPSTIYKVADIRNVVYLNKAARSKEIVEAIRKVHAAGSFASQYVKDALIAYKNLDVEDSLYGTDRELTQVERLVLIGICDEETNAQIALNINRSERTVENIRRRVFEKTQTKTVAGLVKYAIGNGLYRLKPRDEDD